jgi:very-short-patch-repair endonuclease
MSKSLARELRKNMTVAEQHLWRSLRQRQIKDCKFRRQTPIGAYIVDFVCFDERLIVELDGGQHQDNAAYDKARDEYGVEILE